MAIGFLFAAMGIIIGSFLAHAWEHRDPGLILQTVVKKFDANGDGKLQFDEAPARLQDKYDLLDTNGDGAIDAEEAANPGGGGKAGSPKGGIPLPEIITRFDANKDGKLQHAEAPSRMQEKFKILDRNKDGAFDMEEAAYMETMRQRQRQSQPTQ